MTTARGWRGEIGVGFGARRELLSTSFSSWSLPCPSARIRTNAEEKFDQDHGWTRSARRQAARRAAHCGSLTRSARANGARLPLAEGVLGSLDTSGCGTRPIVHGDREQGCEMLLPSPSSHKIVPIPAYDNSSQVFRGGSAARVGRPSVMALPAEGAEGEAAGTLVPCHAQGDGLRGMPQSGDPDVPGAVKEYVLGLEVQVQKAQLVCGCRTGGCHPSR